MSPRVRNGLLVAAAVLALLVVLPWSRRTLRAPATLYPLTSVRLQAPEDAVVAQALVGEGDRVKAGQPILRLVSPAVAEETLRLTSEREPAHRRGEPRPAAKPPPGRSSSTRAALARSRRRSGAGRRARSASSSAARSPDACSRPACRTSKDGRSRPAPCSSRSERSTGSAPTFTSRSGFSTISNRGTPSRPSSGDASPPPVGSWRRSRTPLSHSPATATARAEPLAPKEQPEQFTATTVFDNSDGTLRPGMVGYAKIHGRRASYAARTWRILKRWVQSIAW